MTGISRRSTTAATGPDARRASGLHVRELSVRYGSRAALSGVDLSVPEGEVLAVLGPSGSGKSTLLRAVAGLERPSEGTIVHAGTDLAGVPVHRRGFGMVFQDGQLFPHRDVGGNVEFGLRMRSAGRARRGERVAELLDMVGLTGYRRRRVSDLSGGEAQRVALARALAADPALLLLDEPLASLDRVLREQLAVDLARLLENSETGALVVTHDHDEAFTLADRIAVLVDGRLLQVDRPARLWRYPATEEVATFLGCSTVLPAWLESGTLRCALGSVPWNDDPDVDGKVLLGLRAAGVRASRPEGTAGPDAAVGVVRERVHRHDHVRLEVTVPQAPETGRLEAVAAAGDVPETGEKVHLTLDTAGLALITP